MRGILGVFLREISTVQLQIFVTWACNQCVISSSAPSVLLLSFVIFLLTPTQAVLAENSLWGLLGWRGEQEHLCSVRLTVVFCAGQQRQEACAFDTDNLVGVLQAAAADLTNSSGGYKEWMTKHTYGHTLSRSRSTKMTLIVLLWPGDWLHLLFVKG